MTDLFCINDFFLLGAKTKGHICGFRMCVGGGYVLVSDVAVPGILTIIGGHCHHWYPHYYKFHIFCQEIKFLVPNMV